MAEVRRVPGSAGKALRAAVSALADDTGRVGWFESAKYEDGTPVALVAVVQEYGSAKNGIPPRSYMRSTQAEAQTKWRDDARSLARAVAQGKAPPSAVMLGLTMEAEGAVRKKITSITEPPLKEATIEARKRRHSKGKASSKPLVDTAILLNTLTSQTGKNTK